MVIKLPVRGDWRPHPMRVYRPEFLSHKNIPARGTLFRATGSAFIGVSNHPAHRIHRALRGPTLRASSARAPLAPHPVGLAPPPRRPSPCAPAALLRARSSSSLSCSRSARTSARSRASFTPAIVPRAPLSLSLSLPPRCCVPRPGRLRGRSERIAAVGVVGVAPVNSAADGEPESKPSQQGVQQATPFAL